MLADDGVERVRSVARRPLPSHRKLVHTRADLRSTDARRALQGVDVLFHLGFQLWRDRRDPTAARANLHGTANVLAAAPARVVFASSAAVYGAWPDNPLPIDEGHPPRPNRECPYAEQKLVAERMCADAAASAVATVPALRSYCTDAEIGGSTNRPIEPRQTVSGFCAYANEKRGSRTCSVYVEGETSVNCVPMCWNPAGHVVENTAFAGGGLLGPSGAVVTSSVAGL